MASPHFTPSSPAVAAWGGIALLAAAACITQGPHAYPLYPDPEHPRPAGAGHITSLPQVTIPLDVQAGTSYVFDLAMYPASGEIGEMAWGISAHRRDGSTTAAHQCDGSPLPSLDGVK